MIGLGKWKFSVEMFLFKGDIYLNISNNNGKYVFTPEIPGYTDEIKYDIIEAKESGNTLHVVAETTMLPGKKIISADLMFDGDNCEVETEVPFIGKVNLKNGIRCNV